MKTLVPLFLPKHLELDRSVSVLARDKGYLG